MRKLQKTTIVIWTDPEVTDPNLFEISALAREAEEGAAYCSVARTEEIANPEDDPSWDGTEFFDKDTWECGECFETGTDDERLGERPGEFRCPSCGSDLLAAIEDGD